MTGKSQQDLASLLKDSIQEDGDTRAIEAKDITLNIAVEQQQRERDKEYDERNVLYTELLRNYIASYEDKDNEKRKYKKVFFWVTIVILCLIVAACLGFIGIIVVVGKDNYTEIGAIIGSVIGIITALIAIPKIIAEHLFPVNEESNMIDMVKNMQDNDSNIRNVLYGNHDSEK